jgi:hypothetical protein
MWGRSRSEPLSRHYGPRAIEIRISVSICLHRYRMLVPYGETGGYRSGWVGDKWVETVAPFLGLVFSVSSLKTSAGVIDAAMEFNLS